MHISSFLGYIWSVYLRCLFSTVQAIWREGCWSERYLAPIQSVTPLPHVKGLDLAHWSVMAALALPYYGLVRANLKAGQTVIVNGATGFFGSLGVLVALAMGAGKVVAVGRNEESLAKLRTKLSDKYGARFVAVSSSDPAALVAAADKDTTDVNSGAHIVIDLIGNATGNESTLSCMRMLRRGGALVLEGSMSNPMQFAYGEMVVNNWMIIGNVGIIEQRTRALVILLF